jgi:uncharacterized protein YyaL (SSP411 family)
MIWRFAWAGMDMNGGMYPSEYARRKHDALINAYMSVFGTKLYQATDNQEYLDIAKGLYIWAKENPTERLVGSGACGLMIQAGALLFRISERTHYLDDAREKARLCHELYFKAATDAEGKEFRQLSFDTDPWQNVLLTRGLIELFHTDGEPVYLNDLRKSLDQLQTGSTSPAHPNNRAYQSSLAEINARLGTLLTK